MAAALAAVESTALYAALLGMALTLWPHLLANWNVRNPWGIYVFNIPLEELAWAARFGAVRPLLIAYALDARAIEEPQTAGANGGGLRGSVSSPPLGLYRTEHLTSLGNGHMVAESGDICRVDWH